MLTENSFASLVNKTRENVCELLDLSLGNYYTQVWGMYMTFSVWTIAVGAGVMIYV